MIIINGRFLVHRVTGVERYARELLAELDKIIEPGKVILAVPPEIKDAPNYRNIQIKKVGKLHNRMWEHISLPLYVRKRGISLNLCNVAPLIDPGIVCIHDMKIKARPKDFSKAFLLWYNLLFFNECRRAKKIITVSEFSKREIIKYYHVDPQKIIIIPNAWQHFEDVECVDGTAQKYGLSKGEFYFSVCSIEPNKNLKWIIETAKKNPYILFAVAGTTNAAVFSKELKTGIPSNMKLLGYITDAEVKTLMRECKAFLFPSFYEGFGIPPLEALSAGCKQIYVSDIEAMHEIFGDDVSYIDPNVPEIPPSKQGDHKGVLNYYSWLDNSAPILLDLINEYALM